MPLADVRRRSTLALGEGALASDAGARVFTATPVFAFEIADAGLRFEGCADYFLLTGEGADARVVAISIGLSSEVLARPALDAAQRDAEQRLAAAGWLVGRYEGEVSEPHAARETSSFWRKGETVLPLDARRVDALALVQTNAWTGDSPLEPPTTLPSVETP